MTVSDDLNIRICRVVGVYDGHGKYEIDDGHLLPSLLSRVGDSSFNHNEQRPSVSCL